MVTTFVLGNTKSIRDFVIFRGKQIEQNIAINCVSRNVVTKISITLLDDDKLICRGPYQKMFTMYFARFTEENRKNSKKVFCENIKMKTQIVPKFRQKITIRNY